MKKHFSSLALTALILCPGILRADDPLSLAQTFGTDVFVQNGTSTHREKIFQAEQKIREVIRSEEFRNRIINFSYNGVKRFVNNAGLSNTEIYNRIIRGVERLLPVTDNEMDLKIKTYFQNSSTVGWTTSSSLFININTKFLNRYNPNQTAKTMVHEWLHKLGFTHSKYYSDSRNYSVPYGVGKIVMELASKY